MARKTKKEPHHAAEVIVLPFYAAERPSGAEAKSLDAAVDGAITRVMKEGEFGGKKDEMLVLRTGGAIGAKKIVLAGFGKAGGPEAETFRRVGAAICAATATKHASIVFSIDDLGLDKAAAAHAAHALREGYELAAYDFDSYREKKRPKLARFEVTAKAQPLRRSIAAATAEAAILCEAVRTARDLSNLPGNLGTPAVLAARAKAIAKTNGLKATVLGPKEIERLGMGAFLSVSLGSPVPPRLIVMEWNGAKRKLPCVALVGKGLTFDSGGISIKPADGMEKMRHDKSGGAVVIGTLEAAARLGLPLRLIGIVPSTENMPGSNANKPGDVVRAANGKTIEILNTDAEGRLILADALVHAQRFEPDVIIDLATLTGACMVALGPHCAGLMTRDDELARDLVRAGNEAHERVWRLPLWDEYCDEMKGSISDLKNLAGRYGGALTAAGFLESFTGGKKWAHLDIAGVSWDDPLRPYNRGKGATGFGVRLLVQYLRRLTGDAR